MLHKRLQLRAILVPILNQRREHYFVHFMNVFYHVYFLFQLTLIVRLSAPVVKELLQSERSNLGCWYFFYFIFYKLL